MAVIQISKIQIRRGQTKQTNFPQLASGEFGWSIDNQELFIGNGAVSEGAPAVGNTRVLTDHDIKNLFTFFDNERGIQYTYRNDNKATTRWLQDRLDEQVTLDAFITTSTDCTAALQTAVNYLFNGTITNYGPLLLPGKNYVVTGTVYIPPHAEIRGAGTQKTFITNTSNKSIFQTVAANGGTLLATQNVNISGITFSSQLDNANPIMQLDCLTDSAITNCEFIGNASSSTSAIAVQLRDNAITGANSTDNVLIANCVFSKVSSGVSSDTDITNIKIFSNKFKSVDRGVVLGETIAISSASMYGPTNILISNNTFSDVNKQAIYSGTTIYPGGPNVQSINNTYKNVGNSSNGNTQITEVIRFESPGSRSDGDTFSRLTDINALTFSITSATVQPLVSGSVSLVSKTTVIPVNITTRLAGQTYLIYPMASTSTGLTMIIDYGFVQPDTGVRRLGKLTVAMDSSNTPTVRDEYSFTGPNDGFLYFVAEPTSQYPGYNTLATVQNGAIVLQLRCDINFTGYLTYSYTVRQ
jgi:hypothetical protein